ncbi:MAG: hypothetical protein EOM26_09935, partial [Alphaproteobacteria bacterium]|nr:hypothetical protein [Alphaproteobacteria bacterium]
MSGFDPDRYYTQLKAETYEPLIADLLSSAQGLSSLPVTDELTRARRAFLVVAIKKGTDFSRLLREFPALTAEELPEAAKRLPDKEGLGYQTASVSVSEEDRFAFAAAADKRTPKAQWDNLFPEGQDDIVLPLAGDAESIEDKIESWIARHNERAARKLEEARREDEQARQDNPAAKPRAGRAIEQRTIRRDPEDPSKLQTLNPNKAGDIWEPGPRLGKFMQDSFEWELYDIYQGREATGRSFSAGKVSLRDIANRALFNIDALYDNDNLRVVVSRDPHKIAEMSTGQRWRSCMSMGDGINRHYVPKDIEAGSLVAYLVHKDDVEARWPFMRQMLKPYRNGAGDTILVPAKVYCPGGMKNFRAFDAFKQRTHAFAAELTDGKSGSYRMDETLYADGDPQFVQLQSEWSEEDVRSALYAYLAGSLQEAMAEIKNNAVLLAAGRSGPHGEDPAKNITARRNVIKRLMTPDDSLTGLPRMFYRSMVRQNLGTPVDPRRVDETTRNDPVLRAQSEAFKALSSGDIAKWGFVSANLPAEQRVQAAAAVVAITDEGVGRYEPAVNAVVRSLKDISDPDARLETVLSLHTNAVGGSLFRERMSEELSNAVGEASIGAVSRYSQRILDVLKNDATHFEPIANRLLDE